MKKFISILIGIMGLSFVFVIHEFGHLLAAKWYGVQVPLFSIGFGPQIAGIRLGETIYQIAAIPLGGYVSLNPAQLDAQPFSAQALIILAGIAINILFAYAIFTFFSMRGVPYRQMLQSVMNERGRGFMGPIGIIGLISYSATLGFDYFLLVLAMLSFSIGIFNLLPIPFLDGGQLVRFGREALRSSLPETNYGNPLIAILLILLALYIILRIVLRRRR